MTTQMMKMNQDNIVKIVGLLAAAIIVVATWAIQPVGPLQYGTCPEHSVT